MTLIHTSPDPPLQIQVAQKLWEFEQAKAKEARDKAEAEANTLKAKRRKAKLEALNSTTATNSDALQTTTNNPLSSSLLPEDLSTTPVAGPVLPEYGGLSGLLVHDCGAAILELSNPNLETGVVVATVVASGTPSDPLPAGPSPPSVPVTLPEAEAALKSFLGPPHNFEVGECLPLGPSLNNHRICMIAAQTLHIYYKDMPPVILL